MSDGLLESARRAHELGHLGAVLVDLEGGHGVDAGERGDGRVRVDVHL